MRSGDEIDGNEVLDGEDDDVLPSNYHDVVELVMDATAEQLRKLIKRIVRRTYVPVSTHSHILDAVSKQPIAAHPHLQDPIRDHDLLWHDSCEARKAISISVTATLSSPVRLKKHPIR